MEYMVNGERYVHIREAASMIHRSVQTIRYFLEPRKNRRGMRHVKDGCHIYIPVAEIRGYPFTDPGVISNVGYNVYHYRETESGEWEKYMCKECTYGDGCQAAKDTTREE